jgi:FG-GAP-like repeat
LINDHHSGNGGGQIVAANLTNSGHVDLVVGTGWGTTLAILRGNGDGTFQSPVTYPLPQYDDEGLIVTDVNKDGQPDIVVGTNGGRGLDLNFLTVLLNKGNGDFGPPPPLFSVKSSLNQGTTTNAVGVTLADLTGNNKLDLIVTDWDVPIEPLANGQMPPLPTINFSTQQIDTHGTISVLAGNGDGTFQPEQQYFVGGRPIAVAAGDLTGDGKKDLVVVNAFDNTLSILKGNGDHAFQPAITIPVGTNPNAVVLGDFDGDGKLDIAVTNLVDNTVSILINQSTPGTLNFQTPVNYPVGTYPAGVVTGDFNHDGKMDLAIVCSGNFFSSDPNGKQTALSILLGNGDGSFAPAATQKLRDQTGKDAIAAADFGRGELDLAVAHFGNGELLILHGDGAGSFTEAETHKVGAGPEGIVTMDFNGDGAVDIAVNNLNDNTVTLLIGKGDGTFVPAASTSDDAARPYGSATWGYPAFIAAGDLTGDGKPDIVVSNLFEAAVTLLRNTTISSRRSFRAKCTAALAHST